MFIEITHTAHTQTQTDRQTHTQTHTCYVCKHTHYTHTHSDTHKHKHNTMHTHTLTTNTHPQLTTHTHSPLTTHPTHTQTTHTLHNTHTHTPPIHPHPHPHWPVSRLLSLAGSVSWRSWQSSVCRPCSRRCSPGRCPSSPSGPGRTSGWRWRPRPRSPPQRPRRWCSCWWSWPWWRWPACLGTLSAWNLHRARKICCHR